MGSHCMSGRSPAWPLGAQNLDKPNTFRTACDLATGRVRADSRTRGHCVFDWSGTIGAALQMPTA